MTATTDLRPWQFASLSALPGLRHGITGRAPGLWRDGDTSYGTGGDPARVFANRAAWATSLGLDAEGLVAVRQVHGAAVDRATAADRGRGARPGATGVPEADALLTNAPDLPLIMSFADCTPLIFHDPVRRVVGLAHAGWRGTVSDVAGATVRALVAGYGTDSADLLVGIGPAIGRCCYVVDEPVIGAWQALGLPDGAAEEEIAPRDGRRQWRFDLARANRLLLERAGVRADRIEDAAICTACNVARFPSHRAEAGRAGRFAALIALSRES